MVIKNGSNEMKKKQNTNLLRKSKENPLLQESGYLHNESRLDVGILDDSIDDT